PPADPDYDDPDGDRGGQLVYGDPSAGQRILHLDPFSGDRDDRGLHLPRLFSLLYLLGDHACSDVLPHRDLGGRAKALLRDQVLSLYPLWKPLHASRNSGGLLSQCQSGLWNRPVYVQRPRPSQIEPSRYHPALAFPRLLFGLCGEGADVPLPHLASRRPHRRADRWKRPPRRRDAENGDLWVYPLLP